MTIAERYVVTYEEAERVWLLPLASCSTWLGTTSHFGLPVRQRLHLDMDQTYWSPESDPTIASLAEEVRDLRDGIALLTGLSRQDIAKAMGVDRRSLSGFVTGEIRPSEVRVRSLRVLSDLAAWTSRRFGDRAREVLRYGVGDRSILGLIAGGHVELRREIDEAAEAIGMGSKARVTTRHREHRTPLYLTARVRWSGRVDKPTSGGTVRDPDVYVQDLGSAVASADPAKRPRRARI